MRYRFVAKVFEAPFSPYFDAYKGHEFEIVARVEGHLILRCVTDPSVIVDGNVDDDLVETIT
jgi:hypothetical protein